MDENGGLAMKTGGSMCFNHIPLGFYHQHVRVEIGFHRENAETFGKHANTGDHSRRNDGFYDFDQEEISQGTC